MASRPHDIATIYWLALLRFLGCTGHAHEETAEHHIGHIYTKIDVSTRGAAALFRYAA